MKKTKKLPTSEAIRARMVTERIDDAISVIRNVCRKRHERFDYDTRIPFGVGVDLYILPALRLITEFYPGLAEDEWFRTHFNVLTTVGDLVDLSRAVLNESRDPSF